MPFIFLKNFRVTKGVQYLQCERAMTLSAILRAFCKNSNTRSLSVNPENESLSFSTSISLFVLSGLGEGEKFLGGLNSLIHDT